MKKTLYIKENMQGKDDKETFSFWGKGKEEMMKKLIKFL